MNASMYSVKIPRLTISNVLIEYQWLILCQHAHCVDT